MAGTRVLSVKTENILFDLDGTLIDSLPGIEYSTRAAIAAVIPQRELPDLRRLIGPPVREVLRRAAGEAGPDALDDLERQFRISYDTQGWRKSVAYDGVAEVLSGLSQAQLKCFVVTNKPALPTKKILDELGLLKYFKEVVSLDSRTPPFISKAEATEYLINRHGLRVPATLFVGDSIDDACAAESCGLRFAAATYGYGGVHSASDSPAYIILDSMSRLPSVIEGGDDSE